MAKDLQKEADLKFSDDNIGNEFGHKEASIKRFEQGTPGGSIDYDFEEKVIGKFLGKTLYSKVIELDFETAQQASEDGVNIQLTDITEPITNLVSRFGIYNFGKTTSYIDFTYSPIAIMFNAEQTEEMPKGNILLVRFYNSIYEENFKSCYIIIQYTKE